MIVVIAVGSYCLYQYFEKEELLNTPIMGISEELINTEKKAIEFAKQDAGIIAFTNEYKSDYSANFDKKEGIWQVVADDVNTVDLEYAISFYPNGTITFKGPIPM